MVRRALMHAYAGIGDTLGHPDFQNLGDKQGPFEAYRKMVQEAKYVYDADPADIQGLTDYGAALQRLGVVTPPRGPAKRQTLEQAEELLSRAFTRNAQAGQIGMLKTSAECQLAMVSLANGDRAAGIRYYQMAIATAEKTMGPTPSDFSILRGLIVAVRGLAEEQARGGARADALATLDRALRMAKTVDATAAPTALLLRANVARSWQAAGSVYSILSGREHGDPALRDRQAAQAWYRRALDEWHRLEPQKGFTLALRHEMEAAEQAVASR
jgi:tetratricopeptide (TPR) repeat protein